MPLNCSPSSFSLLSLRLHHSKPRVPGRPASRRGLCVPQAWSWQNSSEGASGEFKAPGHCEAKGRRPGQGTGAPGLLCEVCTPHVILHQALQPPGRRRLDTRASGAPPRPRAILCCSPAALSRQRLRVVLFSGVAVGKTALATQFASGRFPEQHEPTVEELFSKVIQVNAVHAVPALPEIVDTVGAEHLVTLKGLYTENGDGFVVLQGVRSAASFEALRPLRERVGGLRGPKAMRLMLVSTKADLDAERQVLTARGRALAREWRCPFLEVTAESKRMVDQVFTQVVRKLEALAPPPPGEGVWAEPTSAQDTWTSARFIG
ncbi:LOW QUALITY PROTEIN: ras-related protein Rap-2c-like [Phyllostomus discolor]|uniref:LOW QUALITY PROTEIN: ras-related protein Rap-2c-like n=1 Tax=Phyllostomus discolor TaxID=89673 RepID=A0A6J2L7K3_9CHIR|nr:LOW QUALITY PROTEIN: ras-related protein Rap-2c-like [Phyllostomus discolor]